MAGSGIISDIPACPVFLFPIFIVMISGLRIRKPWRKILLKKSASSEAWDHSLFYARAGFIQLTS